MSFLFPSLSEGAGTSLLSAMAHALPVVALARGGVPEIVQDGANGLLVQEASPAALAAAATRLLADGELARRLGEAARQTVAEKFSADRMVEATLAVFERLDAAADRQAPLNHAVESRRGWRSCQRCRNCRPKKENAGCPSARDSRRDFPKFILRQFLPSPVPSSRVYPCRLFPKSSGSTGPPIPGSQSHKHAAIRLSAKTGFSRRFMPYNLRSAASKSSSMFSPSSGNTAAPTLTAILGNPASAASRSRMRSPTRCATSAPDSGSTNANSSPP